jgi:hypothetical protein
VQSPGKGRVLERVHPLEKVINVRRMIESISAAYKAVTESSAYTHAEIHNIEELASQKANPELWAHKFRFALSVLRLTPGEAMELADHSDKAYVEAKREFQRFHVNGRSR